MVLLLLRPSPSPFLINVLASNNVLFFTFRQLQEHTLKGSIFKVIFHFLHGTAKEKLYLLIIATLSQTFSATSRTWVEKYSISAVSMLSHHFFK